MPLNGNSSDRRHWWVAALAILGTVVVLTAFMWRRNDPVPIRTAAVIRGKIRSVISTNGTIEPVANFEAHAPISTTVKRVLVKEGDFVKKGQLLIELDAVDAHAQAARSETQLKLAQSDVAAIERGGSQEDVLNLDAALVKSKADRDTAQRNLDALRRLQQKGAASIGEVKQAEAVLASAQANFTLYQQKQTQRYSKPEIARFQAARQEAQAVHDAAQDVLSKAIIHAPFDGIVYTLPVKQGMFVPGGALLLQLSDLRKVQVRAYVDEPDVGRLAPGDPIEVTWDAIPGRIWHGTVNAIPASVKMHGTRNVGETTCIVENQDLKLLPNVNVGVTIVSAMHDGVLVLPREAVRMDDSKPYVLQVAGHELKRRDVGTSISNLTQMEVTSGLSANDLVAISSLNGKPIGEGTQVKY
jgi:HlyD family secretion protein